MRRVALIILALLGVSLAADAQTPPSIARIGILLFSTPSADPNIPVFRDALRELGWIEGRNVAYEYRFADGRPERLPELAAELAALKPHVIYALGGDVAPSAKQATRTIPIVAVVSNDPVESGLVASLARPGGNVTGLTFLLSDLAAKRLEIVREIMPKASAIGVLWNPDHRDPDFRETHAAGVKLGVRVVSLEARRPEDINAALQTAVRERDRRADRGLVPLDDARAGAHPRVRDRPATAAGHGLGRLGRSRRAAHLRAQHRRDRAPVGAPGRSHSSWRPPGGPPNGAADPLPARYEPRGGADAGPHRTARASGPHRPRDPVTMAAATPPTDARAISRIGYGLPASQALFAERCHVITGITRLLQARTP